MTTSVTLDSDFQQDHELQFRSFKTQNPPHDKEQNITLADPDTNQHYHHSYKPSIFHHPLYFLLATLCLCSSLYRFYIEKETCCIRYTQRKVMSNLSQQALEQKIISQRKDDISSHLMPIGENGLLWMVRTVANCETCSTQCMTLVILMQCICITYYHIVVAEYFSSHILVSGTAGTCTSRRYDADYFCEPVTL